LNKTKEYKVCHLFYAEFPRDPRVRRYVKALNDIGIYCIIIFSKRKGEKLFDNWNGNLTYGIPVAKLRRSFLMTFLEYTLFTFISTFLVSYLGIKYKFKIIHVHSLPDFLIFAAIFNKLFGAKLIMDFHEIFPELFIARKPGMEKSVWVKLLKLGERLSIKLADEVITIHDNAKEIFISRNKGIEHKIHSIMNSVDPGEFKQAKRVVTDEFIIMYNGTVVELLNLTMIVKCLSYLKTKMPDSDYAKIRFYIYGNGPAVKEILSLSRELGVDSKVKHHGFILPSEMYKEILKSSVCILPPLKNIYSDLFYTLKLIEMVYLKIPVIATRLKTYKRYYREESLFYFDSGDMEQLTERVLEVFYNKELVTQKAENAFEDYLKVRWEIMRETYLNIINGLLEKSNP
jgi:glycosyltransferase involved in cell wall biosynthesis